MWGELAPPTAPQERLCHGNRVRIAKWGHPGRERSRSTAVGGPSGSLPADRPSTWKKGGRSVQAPVGTVEGDRGAIECWRAIRPLLGLGAAFLVGSIPFSNIAARLTRGVDLRGVANGTVSGTSLYRVAGFGPLAAAGVLEIGKGAVGLLIVGRDHPAMAALAAGLGVAGHNWSPFLHGAGRRGLSPAIGALGVAAWPGSLVLLGGMAGGKIVGQAAPGSLLAQAALIPVLARLRGRRGALVGAAVLAPMLAKRLFGNAPVVGERPGRVYRDLVIGQAVSSFGDWMGTVALMALVLDLTGSATAVGGILVLRLLPAGFAGPIAAGLVGLPVGLPAGGRQPGVPAGPGRLHPRPGRRARAAHGQRHRPGVLLRQHPRRRRRLRPAHAGADLLERLPGQPSGRAAAVARRGHLPGLLRLHPAAERARAVTSHRRRRTAKRRPPGHLVRRG